MQMLQGQCPPQEEMKAIMVAKMFSAGSPREEESKKRGIPQGMPLFECLFTLSPLHPSW